MSTMRIALASDDGIALAAHPGRVAGFVIMEVEGAERRMREFRANPVAHVHAQGHGHGPDGHDGAGHHSHGDLVSALADCGALVAAGIGPRLVVDLNARGVAVFMGRPSSIDDAVSDYVAGRLTPVGTAGACPER